MIVWTTAGVRLYETMSGVFLRISRPNNDSSLRPLPATGGTVEAQKSLEVKTARWFHALKAGSL